MCWWLFLCHHDDVIKWKHFPRYWPFVGGIHRWPVNSPHKGQWRRTLMFSLICAWINGWVNNRAAGDLRRHRVHYDVIVMVLWYSQLFLFRNWYKGESYDNIFVNPSQLASLKRSKNGVNDGTWILPTCMSLKELWKTHPSWLHVHSRRNFYWTTYMTKSPNQKCLFPIFIPSFFLWDLRISPFTHMPGNWQNKCCGQQLIRKHVFKKQ